MKIQIVDTCKDYERLWFEFKIPDVDLSDNEMLDRREVIEQHITDSNGKIISMITKSLENPKVYYTLSSKLNNMVFKDVALPNENEESEPVEVIPEAKTYVTCERCGKTTLRYKSSLSGKRKFCSRQCRAQSMVKI